VVCPFGFDSGSTPLAGVGPVPSEAMLQRRDYRHRPVASHARHTAAQERSAALESRLQARDTDDGQLGEQVVSTTTGVSVLIEYGTDRATGGLPLAAPEAAVTPLGGGGDD
jgi:hypothetical protein